MSDSPTDRTLASYEKTAGTYADQTGPPNEAVTNLVDEIVARVGAGARVLELGSGTGRDAELFEDRGLIVRRTDATEAFLRIMRDRGLVADRLDIRFDSFGGPWDVVFAFAVLLHLTADDFDAFLARVRPAVRPDGVLAFTVKDGDGAGWTTARLDQPRWFTYWREEPLREALAVGGWSIDALWKVAGRLDDWLYVIARLA